MQPQLIAGRYQVLRAIGRGGMGTVWLCRDEILGREVAVKQIGALPGDSASETTRAMREARSAAALNHPNAVAVYDVVDHESRPWLVMEYVEGETLADEISREGRLSPQRVADIGAQLAGALARAHQRRIVHRDIKPGNVLIDKAGQPKISDFGIARGHGDEQLTQVGFITGTPGYLSPELARGGDPHSASDVWALGATLYSAVEGQPPYEPRSNPIALLRAIATERPRSMTHAGAIGPAINAMMHEDPACRWDMATTARRLGGIARAGAPAVPRRVDPTVTKVIPAPLLEPTQALEPTQRVEAVSPVVPTAGWVTAAPVVVRAPVVEPVVEAPVAAKPVVRAPVVEPVVEPAVANPVIANPVVKRPVAGPVVEAPIVAKSVVEGSVVAKPVVTRPVVQPPAVAKPVAKAPVVVAAAAKHPQSSGSGGLGGGGLLPPRDDRTNRRRWLPLALVAMVMLAIGVVYLLSLLGDQSSTTADPGRRQATASTKPTVRGTPTPSQAPGAGGSAPSSPSAALSADKQLESFVQSYYATVTKNRNLTWAQLSPRMQGFAGGRNGYDGFWKTIRSVRVNRTQANAAANKAVVSLTFTSNTGRTSTETHNFTFLRNGGGYLIESDR